MFVFCYTLGTLLGPTGGAGRSQSLIQLFVHSITQSLTNSFVRSFKHSTIQSFIYSKTNTFWTKRANARTQRRQYLGGPKSSISFKEIDDFATPRGLVGVDPLVTFLGPSWDPPVTILGPSQINPCFDSASTHSIIGQPIHVLNHLFTRSLVLTENCIQHTEPQVGWMR